MQPLGNASSPDFGFGGKLDSAARSPHSLRELNTHLRRKHESEALRPPDFPQTSKKEIRRRKITICDLEIKKLTPKDIPWQLQ